MYYDLLFYPVAVLIVLLVCLVQNREEKIKDPEPDEKEEGGGMVLESLKTAYKSLNKQKAGGWGCWIPACIERAGRGEEVPAAVALMAIRWTRAELAGSRYDLSGLDDSIRALEETTGAGE